MAGRMKDRFLNEITPALMQKFNYSTVMQVPKIEKVVINMGVGEAVANSKVLDTAVEIFASSPVKNRLSRVRRSLLQASSFVKTCRSGLK